MKLTKSMPELTVALLNRTPLKTASHFLQEILTKDVTCGSVWGRDTAYRTEKNQAVS